MKMRHYVLYLLILFVSTSAQLAGQISPTPLDYAYDMEIYTESFEDGVPMGWTNLALDQAKLGGFNDGWVIDRDTTFTTSTGPLMAADGDFYIYCDGSSPTPRGDIAVTQSPPIDLGIGFRPALQFQLNMHGRSGEFYVNVISNGTRTQVLAPVSGQIDGGIHLASEWEEIFIPLNRYRSQTIQLELVTVKPAVGANGDISIDNIRITSSAEPIPTMGEWAVVILFLLLLIVVTVSFDNIWYGLVHKDCSKEPFTPYWGQSHPRRFGLCK